MACFAWLLLVALPVHAESLAMNSGMHAIGRAMGAMSSMPMAKAARSNDCQHAVQAKVQVHVEDCCRGGDGNHGMAASCHCAATAGSAMAAISMIELLPVLPGDMHPTLRITTAPDIAHGPPLRPPAV